MKNLPQIKTCLREIGYAAALFSDSVALWNGTGKVAMVAHSRLPKDLRTAAVVVHDGGLETETDFVRVRATGAAVAIGVSGERWQICRIGRDGPHELGHGGLEKLEGFLRERAVGLHPDAIYRAKAWGRIDPAARQLDFVDAGLMPLVERDMGETLWLRLAPANAPPVDLRIDGEVSCLVQLVGYRRGTKPLRPIHTQNIERNDNELRHDPETLHRT